MLPDAQAQYLGSPKFPNDGCYKASFNEFNMNLNEDGSFDAYFGECGDVDNNLPTVDGWNYIMRIYEPKLDELQDFRLPEMKKVS